MRDGSLAPSILIGSVAALALGGLWLGSRTPPTPPPPEAPAPPKAATIEDEPTEEEGRSYSFRVPSGEPTSLACGEARRIVEQVRVGLAYDPEPLSARAFAESTADWLDPHELWALAADAPTAAAIDARAAELLAELEGRKLDDCAAARTIGRAIAAWVDELRATFDAARVEKTSASAEDAKTLPLLPPGSARVTAREVSKTIGHRVGAFERALGDEAKKYANAARGRFFPELDAEGWSKVVLAAAVRAYVPLVDPHGAWAPFDEEASVYEVELSARPPEKLWESGDFTTVGFRLREGAAAPLAKGDVLLAIAGVPVAGLPLEQLDQLGYAAADARTPTAAIVLRDGEKAPRTLDIGGDADPSGGHERDPLPVDRAHYGEEDVLVVSIRDVRDDLGDQLSHALKSAREQPEERPLAGVVLDLRGNGGGSTDGAIDALAIFMPGMPLFPMKRRDGTIETDRAPEPPATERWTGPLATIVDGATASAAEMIAGAIAVYKRGPSVGSSTYGKGCAQEYVDDDARAGVLRLTTLLYALPDGSPVQRVGIAPTLRLPFPTTGGANDREASLPHAAPTWRGPDVREKLAELPSYTWPSTGLVGPCKDMDVCRALRALGTGGKRPIAAKR